METKFSKRLQILRTSHSLTQKQAATAINIKQYNLSDYETGRALPDIETLIKLADLYEVTLDDLCCRDTSSLTVSTTSSSTIMNDYVSDMKTLKIINRIKTLSDNEKEAVYKQVDSVCKNFFNK